MFSKSFIRITAIVLAALMAVGIISVVLNALL